MACGLRTRVMARERWIRGVHDEASSFDWHRAARELDVPLDEARGLYEEARRRATYPGSRRAEDLYLDWLEAVALSPAGRSVVERGCPTSCVSGSG